MAIATLTIDIVAKLASLQTGFDKAAQLAERNSKRIEQAFNAAGAALKTAFAGFGVQQLVQAFNATADGLAKFKDVAEQTGIAVDELSKLEPVARGAGLALEDVGSLSLKLSKALSGVDDESKGAGKALQQIGIELARFKQLGAAEQMQTLARALNNFADDGNKAAIGQAILGREWAKAAGYLKDLAEAGELNATVTAKQAAAADEYNKQIARVQQNITQLARSIASELIPALNNTFDRFRQIDWDKIFGAGPLPGMMLREYGKQLDEINRKELQRAQAVSESAGVYDELERLMKRSPKPSVGSFTGTAEAVRKATKELAIVTDEYAASIRRAQEEERNRQGEEEKRTAGRAAEERLKLLDKLAEATGRLTRAQQEQIALAQKLLDVGDITEEDFGLLVLDALPVIKQTNEELQKTTDIARDLGMTFSSAFEDAIVGGKSLQDVIRGLEQDILRLVTRQLVTEPLAKVFTGFAKNIGSDAGGFLSQLFTGSFASGTDYVPRTGLALVHQGEKIIPAASSRAASSVTINIAGNATRETASQIAAAVSRQLAVANARAFA